MADSISPHRQTYKSLSTVLKVKKKDGVSIEKHVGAVLAPNSATGGRDRLKQHGLDDVRDDGTCLAHDAGLVAAPRSLSLPCSRWQDCIGRPCLVAIGDNQWLKSSGWAHLGSAAFLRDARSCSYAQQHHLRHAVLPPAAGGPRLRSRRNSPSSQPTPVGSPRTSRKHAHFIYSATASVCQAH